MLAIIWCTKYRRKILLGKIETKLKEIINKIANENKVEIIELETDQDHVHLLAEVDPQFGVAKFIRLIKGRSSYILRNEFSFLKQRLPTLWSNSYFVSTVGGAPLAMIKQYIENQQKSQAKSSQEKWKTYLRHDKKML